MKFFKKLPINKLLIFVVLFISLNNVLYALTVNIKSIGDIKTDIKNIQNSSDMYNYINHLEYSKENLNFLLDLWNLNKKLYPTLPWNILSEDISRLSIASVLMQGKHQCLIDINLDDFHDFVLEKSKYNDKEIRFLALHDIGIAKYKNDIPYLESIVLEEQDGLAEAAAGSIFTMNSDFALTSLKKLEKQVKRETLRDFISHFFEGKTYPMGGKSMACIEAERSN